MVITSSYKNMQERIGASFKNGAIFSVTKKLPLWRTERQQRMKKRPKGIFRHLNEAKLFALFLIIYNIIILFVNINVFLQSFPLLHHIHILNVF